MELFNWKPKRQITRADQILDQFEDFHKKNPAVWELFKRFTFETIHKGWDHYSVNAVVERIRWHSAIETTGDETKINNNFHPHYARLFHIAFPQYDGFFRTRKLISEETPGSDNPDRHIEFTPASEEIEIKSRLTQILNGAEPYSA